MARSYDGENQELSYKNSKPRYHEQDSCQSKQDLFSYLPDECIFEIFAFLPSSKDRCSCSAVSKKWLNLQANMRNTEFKSIQTGQTHPDNPNTISKVSGLDIRRCLDGKNANDTRLAAIAVGTDRPRKLIELCIRASFPSLGITDSGLALVGLAFPALKSLTLWNCLKVGNQGLVSISQGCALLEKLDLFDSPFIGDQALTAIAKHCPNLSVLSLQKCPQIGNESMIAFGKFSTKLESVCLGKCPLVRDEGVLALVSCLPKLEKLKLVSMNVSNDGIEAIWEYGSGLKSLCLEGLSRITEMGFCSLGKYENLTTLSLKSCTGLSEASFSAMGIGLLGLKRVSVRNCDSLTDHGLKEFTRFASVLESLKLEECKSVTLNGLLQALRNCRSSLKVLSLVKCEGIEEPTTPTWEISVPKCRFLESITIRNCSRVGDVVLSLIGISCLKIRNLELSRLSSVTDQGILTFLRGVRKEASPVTVDLNGCFRITDWSIFAIASLCGEKLQSLNMEGCERVTDASLEIIAEICPSLLDLDISKCGITDKGVLCLVKKLQLLKVLTLCGCLNITSDCLDFLELMGANLIGLNLKNCPRLSKESIESIRETLWWCDIVI